MQLPKGLYKRGKSYYLDYKGESGRRVRRSAGSDLHLALALLERVRAPRSEEDGDLGL